MQGKQLTKDDGKLHRSQLVAAAGAVGNGDGANSTEHSRRLREDLKAYTAASRTVAKIMQQNEELQVCTRAYICHAERAACAHPSGLPCTMLGMSQNALLAQSRGLAKMALTVQRLMQSVQVNAEMLPGARFCPGSGHGRVCAHGDRDGSERPSWATGRRRVRGKVHAERPPRRLELGRQRGLFVRYGPRQPARASCYAALTPAMRGTR